MLRESLDSRGDVKEMRKKTHYTVMLLLLSPVAKKNVSTTIFESRSPDSVE